MAVEVQNNKKIIESQNRIFWRQAIVEAIQDSYLKTLSIIGEEDLGELDSYYKNVEIGFILKGKIRAGKKMSVIELPSSLIEAMMTKEVPLHIQLINRETGEIYRFYRSFHDVANKFITIPQRLMLNLQKHQVVVVKMRMLPIWEFVNNIKGDTSDAIKLNKNGILILNLGGKKIMIESFDYNYAKGGRVYVEFQVEDVYNKSELLRIYYNGYNKSSFAMKRGKLWFCSIDNIEYNSKQDILLIKYDSDRSTLYFMGPPDELDLSIQRIPEDMRVKIQEGNLRKRGEIGEYIAKKIAEEN